MTAPPTKEKAPPLTGSNATMNLTKTAPLASPVAQVQRLIGKDAVLLPCPHHTKGPRSNGWPDTTMEAMSDPAHIDALNAGNIAVLLGKVSDGLCTIDIDNDEDAAAFLALNPQLQTALRTRRVRGCNVWVRIAGQYPVAADIKGADGRNFGEWRCDGRNTMIHGEAIDRRKGETEPTRYTVVIDGSVAEIRFDEILWPHDLVLPWSEHRLRESYGDPYLEGKKEGAKLNQGYFAGRFTTEHVVLHEAAERCFYSYEAGTGLWRQQSVDSIKKKFSDDYHRLAMQWKKPELLPMRTNALLNAFADLLRGEVEQRGCFDNRGRVIHVANGMMHLDCDPPELRVFGKEYFSRNQCPIAFDESADCPRFRNELLASALDPEDVSLIQRWAGLCLLGRNLTQRLMLFTGSAGGGKSTLVSIIENVIGRCNIAELRTNLLLDRFELFSFVGKTLLTGKDVPADFLSTAGATVIKKLCGGDLVDAEGKGQNRRVQMKGEFNIAITCNSRLRVRLEGDTGAWRRRILMVNYERPKPAKPVRDFDRLLIDDEGPGILNWMIEGAVAHLRELDECGDFVLTPRQIARVDALLSESDSVRYFVRHGLAEADGGDVTTDELVSAYVDFCDGRGWDALSRRAVENQLADLMLERFRASKRNDIKREGKSQKGFAGVAISPEEKRQC